MVCGDGWGRPVTTKTPLLLEHKIGENGINALQFLYGFNSDLDTGTMKFT